LRCIVIPEWKQLHDRGCWRLFHWLGSFWLGTFLGLLLTSKLLWCRAQPSSDGWTLGKRHHLCCDFGSSSCWFRCRFWLRRELCVDFLHSRQGAHIGEVVVPERCHGHHGHHGHHGLGRSFWCFLDGGCLILDFLGCAAQPCANRGSLCKWHDLCWGSNCLCLLWSRFGLGRELGVELLHGIRVQGAHVQRVVVPERKQLNDRRWGSWGSWGRTLGRQSSFWCGCELCVQVLHLLRIKRTDVIVVVLPERDLGRAQRRCKFGRRVVHQIICDDHVIGHGQLKHLRLHLRLLLCSVLQNLCREEGMRITWLLMNDLTDCISNHFFDVMLRQVLLGGINLVLRLLLLRLLVSLWFHSVTENSKLHRQQLQFRQIHRHLHRFIRRKVVQVHSQVANAMKDLNTCEAMLVFHLRETIGLGRTKAGLLLVISNTHRDECVFGSCLPFN